MNIKEFLERYREESLSIFQGHSGNYKTSLQEEREVDGKNIWKSFIFVGGSKFKFMFEVRFSTISLLSLSPDRFSDMNEIDYIDGVKDFMREFCNLMAGKLKACFEKESDAFMGLPIIARSYDLEKIFSENVENIESVSWQIGEDQLFISLSAHFFTPLGDGGFESLERIASHLDSDKAQKDIDFF